MGPQWAPKEGRTGWGQEEGPDLGAQLHVAEGAGWRRGEVLAPGAQPSPGPYPQAQGSQTPISGAPRRLKALGEGSKQWSSSAPNLGKSPKHTPIAPGFASLNEMGKRVRVPFGGRGVPKTMG